MNLPAFFKAALEASWQGSLAIIIILTLRPLLHARIPAGWRSFLWTLALIRLLVPAFLLPSSPASVQNYAGAEQSVNRVRLVWAAGQGADVEKSIAANPLADSADPKRHSRSVGVVEIVRSGVARRGLHPWLVALRRRPQLAAAAGARARRGG